MADFTGYDPNSPYGISLNQFGASTDPGSIQTAQNNVNNIVGAIQDAAYGTPQAAPAAFPTGTGVGTDPNAPGGTGGGGTTTLGPDNSQKIQSYQDVLNNLPNQLNAGNQSIDQSYNTSLQQLLGQRNLGQQSYDTGKQNSATSYVGAKNTIGSQAGSALNGLLRLLGSRGAGGGISDVLRQAVARNASIQRNNVSNTFGQNQQALDQNWGQFLQNYNDQVQNAGTQQRINKEALANKINESRVGLNQSIAGLQSSPANAQPYLDTAQGILAQLSNYVTPSFNYSTTPYQAPTAASYTTAPPPTAGYASNSPANDYASPYLQTLLGKKQQTA